MRDIGTNIAQRPANRKRLLLTVGVRRATGHTGDPPHTNHANHKNPPAGPEATKPIALAHARERRDPRGTPRSGVIGGAQARPRRLGCRACAGCARGRQDRGAPGPQTPPTRATRDRRTRRKPGPVIDPGECHPEVSGEFVALQERRRGWPGPGIRERGGPAPGRGGARARRVGASGGAGVVGMSPPREAPARRPARRWWTATRARAPPARAAAGRSGSRRPANCTVLSGRTTRSYLKPNTRSGSKAGGGGREQDPPHRRPAARRPLDLGQRLGPVPPVEAGGPAARPLDHRCAHPGRHDPPRGPAGVAVDQRGRPDRPAGRLQALDRPLRQPPPRRRLAAGQDTRQQLVQDPRSPLPRHPHPDRPLVRATPLPGVSGTQPRTSLRVSNSQVIHTTHPGSSSKGSPPSPGVKLVPLAPR
jgi:hypothetical protein